jgi:oxygen-independent coproporphyrinogen-3 oxidase
MENEVMLGLRKLGGISISLFKKKFNKDIFEEFNIKYALDQGMIEISDDFIYIPEDKIYVMNEIINTII